MARAVIGLGLVAVITACALAMSQPIEPPRIQLAGVPTEVRVGTTVEYELADGTTRRIDPDGWRVITPHGWSGELVVLGTDAAGPFVAAFVTQGGLPDDCYVENQTGTDRDGYIEIHGILWQKASAFVPAMVVGVGQTYPAGTRFCFTEEGRIGSTVPP